MGDGGKGVQPSRCQYLFPMTGLSLSMNQIVRGALIGGSAHDGQDISIYFRQVSACRRRIRLLGLSMEASHMAVRMLVFISNDDDRSQLVGGELVPFYFRQSNFVGNWCSQREPNNLIGGRLTLTVTEIMSFDKFQNSNTNSSSSRHTPYKAIGNCRVEISSNKQK